tara:strand:+ start:74 stop:697 length:624 start_codon:yes stop_codon:yes gene_type:complete
MWLAVIPFIAKDLISRPNEIVSAASAAGRRLWQPTIVVCMVGYGLFLHYTSLGFPGITYPKDSHLVGWADLARQIEMVEDELEKRTGIEPVVVGMDHYGIASRLSFYRKSVHLEQNQPREREGITHTTGRHLFGGGSLMYETWFPLEQMNGAPMIVIDDDARDLEAAYVTDRFQHISPLQKIDVLVHGRDVAVFYYRIGYGYLAPAG